MTARHRVRSAVVGFVVLVLTGSAVPVSAAATSSEPAPDATVVDVPLGPRAEPRHVEVLSTDGADTLVVFETDTRFYQRRVLHGDGTWTDLDGRPDLLTGGYLVTSGVAGGDTLARPLAGGEPVVLGDEGRRTIGTTPEGLLESSRPPGALQVTVRPWDGSASRPVAGLPSDLTDVSGFGRAGGPGAFVRGVRAGSEVWSTYWVDASAGQAWQVPSGSDPVASATSLAWWRAAPDGTIVVESVPRPVPGDPVGQPLPRSTGLAGQNLPGGVRVELAGDEPLLVLWEEGPTGLRLVTSRVVDGGLVPLLVGAGRAGPDGRYVAAVRDPDPLAGGRIEAVAPADGTAVTVVAYPPVPSRASELAVGNGRVYVRDDGIGDGPVSYALDDTTLGGRTPSATAADGPFSAGGGHLLVAPPSTTAQVHAPDGTLLSSAPSYGLGAPTVSHGTVALSDVHDGWRARDWVDGSIVGPSWLSGTDVSGGMVIGYSSAAYAAAQGTLSEVSVLDPRTGRVDAVDLSSRCSTPGPGVQAVGTWLLTDCDGVPSVLDRLSTAPAMTLSRGDGPAGTLTLGDGFVVRVVVDEDPWATSGALDWLDVRTPQATWQRLGQVLVDPHDGRAHDRLSVSRDGTTPAVAWLDADGGAQVAFLPVAPLPPMPVPTGPTTAPGAVTPTLSSPAGSARVDVSWAPRPASEQVIEHVVRLAHASQPAVTVKTLRLPGPATSATFPGLSTWGSYRVTVMTRNAIASATSAAVEAKVVPRDTVGPYSVAATVPAVSLGSTSTLRPTAADTTSPVVAVDVRVRQAATGKALGGWTYPAAWQRMANRNGGTPVPLSGLARGHTYCYSVRARDYFDNVSVWSAQTCTTVPIDDPYLKRSPSFRQKYLASYFNGTGSRSASYTATASRAGTRANAGWLVASTCPSCGVVGVYDDGVLLGKINLYSATTQHKRVLALPFGGKARSGTITVKVLSPSGKVVLVDGLALRSY